jgi:hypothetical protein
MARWEDGIWRTFTTTVLAKLRLLCMASCLWASDNKWRWNCPNVGSLSLSVRIRELEKSQSSQTMPLKPPISWILSLGFTATLERILALKRTRCRSTSDLVAGCKGSFEAIWGGGFWAQGGFDAVGTDLDMFRSISRRCVFTIKLEDFSIGNCPVQCTQSK